MADSINSFVASLFSTFPNTTFSQNNGVIRLTGVSSPYIGLYTAGLLILLGLFPIVAGLLQAMPQAVLYGATLLMFVMVAYGGYRIITISAVSIRDLVVVISAILGGYFLSSAVSDVDYLPKGLQLTLQFPASTGAILAIIIEALIPKSWCSKIVYGAIKDKN